MQSAAAQTVTVPSPTAPSVAAATSPAPSPVHADDERIPIRGIRKAVSERMTKSVNSIPHVTHVEEVDVTELVLLREALKGSAEKREVKLTYLPLIIKAVIPTLRRFPYINASFDEKSGDIILKKRYNIGIATDTEQGLVVPVVKDADSKDIFELSTEIGGLAEKGRAGQLTLDEVRVDLHDNQPRGRRGPLTRLQSSTIPRLQSWAYTASRRGRSSGMGRWNQGHDVPVADVRPSGPRRGPGSKVRERGDRYAPRPEEAARGDTIGAEFGLDQRLRAPHALQRVDIPVSFLISG